MWTFQSDTYQLNTAPGPNAVIHNKWLSSFVSLASGALSVLAFAPFGLWLVLPFTLAIFFWLTGLLNPMLFELDSICVLLIGSWHTDLDCSGQIGSRSV